MLARGEGDFGVGDFLVALAVGVALALDAGLDRRPLPFLAAFTSIVSAFCATKIRFSILEISSGNGTTSRLRYLSLAINN